MKYQLRATVKQRTARQHVTRLLFATLTFFVTAAETSGQETRELWRWSSHSKITMQALVLPSGQLFVSSDDATMLLSADGAKVLWSRKDVVSCRIHPGYKLSLMGVDDPTCLVGGKPKFMSFFRGYLRLESRNPDGSPYARFKDSRFQLVDLENGQVAFDTSSLGLKRVSATCLLPSEGVVIAWDERGDTPALAAAFDLSGAKTLWTGELPLSKNIQCLPLNAGGAWLAYGESDRGKRRVFAIESSTGRVRWESQELAGNGWEKRLGKMTATAFALTDSAAVVHVDKSGPARIDLNSGAVQWRADVFRRAQPAGVIIGRGDRLFITREKELAALEPTSGAVVWKREFPQAVTIWDTTSHGLLVHLRNSDGLNLLRYETGESVWAKPIDFEGTNWLLREDTLFHVWNNKLRSLALETGVERELGAVKFEGGDFPSDVELLDDVVLVRASQNVVAYERDGRLRYQRYYKAPGLSVGQMLLRSALAAAATQMSQYVARSQAQDTARIAAFASGGSATAWYTYRVYTPNVDVRFSSTTNTVRFVYMYTEDDTPRKGFSLVQLDKKDGKETGRLWLKNRQPDYSVDPFTAHVFVETGDKEITAYSFAVANAP